MPRTTSIRSALLIHGAGGGGWEWNLWRGVLRANGIHVCAPDLQPSAAGLAATRFGDYEAQMRAALSVLRSPRVVIGASLGGLVAMRVADLADAVVLVNALPPAPWHRELPPRDWPTIVPWRNNARLVSTLRSLPDSDEATALYAFRHWRDESGAVLRQAYAGIQAEAPRCPTLFVVSSNDEDVPPPLSVRIASAWCAEVVQTGSISHAGPLLSHTAAAIAGQTVAWLNRKGAAGGIQTALTALA
ncbi:alpha/beta hydrolase [Pseudoxanthomonas sp. UTMC 1351]|uniref:alpha/beta hydrolase n=1 Tax=Pseudoxanthomonas sp. UTMC 1351 TaxID=2695853 RepID=UPI0034CF2435